MSLYNFFLLPKLKQSWKANASLPLKISYKNCKASSSAFEKCLGDWKKCWHTCVLSDGDYSEGHNITIEELRHELFEQTSYFFLLCTVAKKKNKYICMQQYTHYTNDTIWRRILDYSEQTDLNLK